MVLYGISKDILWSYDADREGVYDSLRRFVWNDLQMCADGKEKKRDNDSVSYCGNSRRRIRPARPVVSPGGVLGSRLKPTSTALKVMRVNSRLGDSYGSLAPGLCGRKASRDVSAQDLPPDPDGDR